MFHEGERDANGMTAVTFPLAAGPHTVTLRCTEQDGDIEWDSNNVSAVTVGNG
jgi:hypothetical protein